MIIMPLTSFVDTVLDFRVGTFDLGFLAMTQNSA